MQKLNVNRIHEMGLLAHTYPLFIYLSAILEIILNGSSEGVSIQMQLNVDIFNVAHFEARTKTS